jgi:16S rRNA (guanine527-N7)-methyltransferase
MSQEPESPSQGAPGDEAEQKPAEERAPAPPPSEIEEPPIRIFQHTLERALGEMNLRLPPIALDHLKCVFELLAEANTRMNLVSDASPEAVAIRHIADSLLLLTTDLLSDLEVERAIDIGSGAGFPGLPLALAMPGAEWMLCESRGKKARHLEEVVFSLGLDQVAVNLSRSEDLAHNVVQRESRDLVVFRGMASAPTLCELGLPFLKPGGRLIAYKGPEGPGEMESAAEAARLCGGTPRPPVSAQLPILGHARMFLSWDKTGLTPPQYPRREGMPQKRPLG